MNTPLLLSGPVKVIREAARATKGKAGLMIERVTAGTLSKLLGLPGMVGFTSGVVEGLNNAIRGTIRRAYGYHVFENFRLQIMVEHGDLPTPLPQI